MSDSVHSMFDLVDSGLRLDDCLLDLLIKQALMQAETGAIFVAPSDRIDGRISAIHQGLDAAG